MSQAGGISMASTDPTVIAREKRRRQFEVLVQFGDVGRLYEAGEDEAAKRKYFQCREGMYKLLKDLGL
jgi:hypothetical protein